MTTIALTVTPSDGWRAVWGRRLPLAIPMHEALVHLPEGGRSGASSELLCDDPPDRPPSGKCTNAGLRHNATPSQTSPASPTQRAVQLRLPASLQPPCNDLCPAHPTSFWSAQEGGSETCEHQQSGQTMPHGADQTLTFHPVMIGLMATSRIVAATKLPA